MKKMRQSKRSVLMASGVQLRTAQSLNEFIQVVETISPSTRSDLWFRGQSDASHRLIPGTLRQVTPITDGYKRPIIEGQIVTSHGGEVTGVSAERMLAAFKRQARPFLEWSPANDFEWMFVAQHHRLPTRLLDWTTNALAALFFAASGAEEREGCGEAFCKSFVKGKDQEFSDDGFAVFVIDPGALNKEARGVSDPIDIAANPERWEGYLNLGGLGLKEYLPICVVAPHITSRIRAQSGAFTLHGSNVWPIDYYDVIRPLITKIFIPFTATRSIKRSLNMVGITHSFIYPSLDTIAHDIAEAEALRHVAEMSDYFSSTPDGGD